MVTFNTFCLQWEICLLHFYSHAQKVVKIIDSHLSRLPAQINGFSHVKTHAFPSKRCRGKVGCLLYVRKRAPHRSGNWVGGVEQWKHELPGSWVPWQLTLQLFPPLPHSRPQPPHFQNCRESSLPNRIRLAHGGGLQLGHRV